MSKNSMGYDIDHLSSMQSRKDSPAVFPYSLRDQVTRVITLLKEEAAEYAEGQRDWRCTHCDRYIEACPLCRRQRTEMLVRAQEMRVAASILASVSLPAYPPEPTCHMCGRPAECFGEYEGHRGYSCGVCCGHGNEDGWCRPVEKHTLPERLRAVRLHPEVHAGLVPTLRSIADRMERPERAVFLSNDRAFLREAADELEAYRKLTHEAANALDAAQQEDKEIRKSAAHALHVYGVHLDECEWNHHPGDPPICSCGLRDAEQAVSNSLRGEENAE